MSESSAANEPKPGARASGDDNTSGAVLLLFISGRPVLSLTSWSSSAGKYSVSALSKEAVNAPAMGDEAWEKGDDTETARVGSNSNEGILESDEDEDELSAQSPSPSSIEAMSKVRLRTMRDEGGVEDLVAE